MDKIINFPKGAEIPLQHTEQFFESARQLSEFIKGLPLPLPDNDRLIALILSQMEDGTKDAFVQGFHMGREFEEWEKKK